MIGTTVGKYRIVGKLGRGGMGTVYRAIDETLDRDVAIKVLNSDVADAKLMSRFRAEATTLAKLNHPEIATIYEIHKSETDLFMVMELVRGETLEQLSARVGPLSPERAGHLVAQILHGLGHAHRAGIVHRDLKPANVMISETGLVKLMDFGIARVLGAEHLTSDGTLMGTPAYMAPEQILGTEIDARADLYAAGVVFYRLLTGCVPFQAETPIAVVHKQLWDAPPPLRSHRKDLPDWCETILARALAKSPDDRFQTAEEFRTALLSALGYTPGILHGDTMVQAPASAEWSSPTTPVGGLTPAELAAAPTMTVMQSGAGANAESSGGLEASAIGVPRMVDSAALASSAALVSGQASVPPMPASVANLDSVEVSRASGSVSVAPAVAAVAASLSSVEVVAQPKPPVSRAHSRSRTAMFGGAAALVVLVIVGLAFGLKSRTSTVPAPSAALADAGSTTPPTPAPAAAAAETPTPTTGDAAASPETPAVTNDASSRPAIATTPAPKPSAAPSPRKTTAPTTPPAANAEIPSTPPEPSTPAPVETTPPPTPAGNTLPPVTFSAQTLVVEEGRNRQRDTNIELANGSITVTGKDQKLVTSIPYDSIVGISYSNSKQPMWNTPDGPAEVAHVDGGAFGFLKGGQHWVSVRTEHMSLVWRVRDQDSRRMILAIEERTGKKVEVVKPR